MNRNIKPKTLKFAVLGAGVLGLVLRIALYAAAVDGRGLLVRNHPLSIAIWVLTVLVAAALVFFCRGIKGPESYAAAYPVSFQGFVGCIAAAACLLLAQVRSFGNFSTVLDIVIWGLGIAAGVALSVIGVCRLSRRKPYYLLHSIVCVYFALHLVTCYRRWSADPSLHDYFLYLMACMALMLTAYHHAAFDAGMGSHRALWCCSLAGGYCCCAALWCCEEWLLLAGCAAWCFTGLTDLTVRKRRTRPTLKLDESEGAQS